MYPIQGGMYAYKDKVVEGRKTDNMFVLGIIDNKVMHTTENAIKELCNSHKNFGELPIRKISISNFKKWYPVFLFKMFK